MKPLPVENLAKAKNSMTFLCIELRAAHSDAATAGNQFAELAIFDLIEQAAALRTKLERVVTAAKP